MSSVLMGWALRAIRDEFKDLSTGARFTLLLLADHFNDDKGAAWPSHDRLADIMGVSKRSVVDYMKELKEAGIVSQTNRMGKTSYYTIGVQNLRTPLDAPVQNLHHTCEKSAQGVCKICVLTTYEPLKEHKANHCKICTGGQVDYEDEAGYLRVKPCPNGCIKTTTTKAEPIRSPNAKA